MLHSEDLHNGLQLDMPGGESITLEKPAHIRGPGNKLTYQWLDTDSRCWDETYLLQHGRPRASGVEALTTERKSTHGDWAEQSRVFDNLMYQLINSVNWSGGKLNHMHRASLINIAQKMSRICTGDPNVEDHWNDIQGYAHLGKGGHK